MSDLYKNIDSIKCHQCGADNPKKAYCCLTCYKVLRPKENLPWWKTYIQLTGPRLILVLAVAFGGIYLFRRWMHNLEAQVTMNFKTEEYNLSVVADKKKKAAAFDVTSTSESPPPAAE